MNRQNGTDRTYETYATYRTNRTCGTRKARKAPWIFPGRPPHFSAHCPPPTVHCSLPAVHCSLPTVHCSLPTVHCSLPTYHCSLPTDHCFSHNSQPTTHNFFSQPTTHNSRSAFTLVELLIVITIVAILSLIGLYNFRMATERALKSSDAANLRTIGTALQMYQVDYGTLPPADREAGPFESHTSNFTAVGNGPAAGGSWDGVPWLLVTKGYIGDWRTLFCPKYLRRYSGAATIRGGYPRYHNFRYAYNSSGLSSGGHAGGAGNVMSGEVWIVRDLWLGPRQGFYAASWPNPPADFTYPWGEGDQENQLEHVLYSDMAVRTVVGGKNEMP